MRYKVFVLIIILIGLVSNIFPQTLLRSGLFLHHSAGGIIWGNSSPSIPQLINMYNTEKNYTGNNAVTMNIDPNFFPPVVNLVIIIGIAGTLFSLARVPILRMMIRYNHISPIIK